MVFSAFMVCVIIIKVNFIIFKLFLKEILGDFDVGYNVNEFEGYRVE